MPAFTTSELARYNRHLLIPGFGLEAQEKLKHAKVLVIGCGGLGSPLLLYLAAAGVGSLGLVDDDLVDESNLQRQVIFNSSDIGRSKVEAAKEKILALNPFVTVHTYPFRINSSNALQLFEQYDLIADGSDNFPTRYLVNDAAVISGRPLVYGSVSRFEGQVAVFNHADRNGTRSPDYRDLYPVPPAPRLIPSCEEGGVVGVLPGIIGSMQALEVIKILTGLGDPLVSKYFVFDALSCETRTFHYKADPGREQITSLIDYDAFCGINQTVPEISVIEFVHMRNSAEDFQLIDVREKQEFAIANIGGLLIPLSSLEQNIALIDRKKKVIIHCKSGSRSRKAIQLLQEQYGFTNLLNLTGGILSYIDQVDPSLTRY